jgi:hypothetical protein
MRSFIGSVPLSLVAFAGAILLAVALSPTVARRLGTPRVSAALLLSGFGLVMAATLSPDADALGGMPSDGTCDFARIGLAPIEDLRRITEASLNVLLFLPLGVAIGLLPRTRPGAAIAIAAFSLTFVVESTQLLLPVLGRGCQIEDIFDNLLGLILGIGIGLVARQILGLWPGRDK